MQSTIQNINRILFLLSISCYGFGQVSGCLDNGYQQWSPYPASPACNYNPNAIIDDGSCMYNDCLGACGGSAKTDECGTCYEDGNNNNSWNTTCADCSGETNGLAYKDACDECVGGNTGKSNCLTHISLYVDTLTSETSTKIPVYVTDIDSLFLQSLDIEFHYNKNIIDITESSIYDTPFYSDTDDDGIIDYRTYYNTTILNDDSLKSIMTIYYYPSSSNSQLVTFDIDTLFYINIKTINIPHDTSTQIIINDFRINEHKITDFNSTVNINVQLKRGCIDESACNYDAEAYINDGSCIYYFDCLGNCGGLTQTDECGVCQGDENDGDIDGDGVLCEGDCVTEIDCNGDCKTTSNCPGNSAFPGCAKIDECNICDSNPDNDCIQDCNGDWGGIAVEDECGVCGGAQFDGDIDNNNNFCETECNGTLDCKGVCNGDALKDNCGVCDNNGDNDCVQDCNGDWGGISEFDGCGVCDNNPSNDCSYDCSHSEVECNGVWLDNYCWGGDALKDNCGVCDNNSDNDCIQDCNGILGGYAILDDCLLCNGNNINKDCAGECTCDENGENCNNELDECGTCGGNGVSIGACDCNGNILDCAGECTCDENGENCDNKLDTCGICNGLGKTHECCNGDLVCNPEDCLYQLDNCSLCDDNPSNDCMFDCMNIENGHNTQDNCGVCDNDSSNDCVQDCAGIWGGTANIDNCEICVGGTTEVDPCTEDCNGTLGGTFWMSECGCVSADNSGDECDDCTGTPYGTAYYDYCVNCIEIDQEDSYECSMDCLGVWGGTHIPTFPCLDNIYVCHATDCNLSLFDVYLPSELNINKIFPNPFNPQTTIEYQVSEPANIKLEIYNIRGQKVDELINKLEFPGYYIVNWNGSLHPSGIYFVILYSNQAIIRRKIILLK